SSLSNFCQHARFCANFRRADSFVAHSKDCTQAIYSRSNGIDLQFAFIPKTCWSSLIQRRRIKCLVASPWSFNPPSKFPTGSHTSNEHWEDYHLSYLPSSPRATFSVTLRLLQ
ncbi:hypothetical protein AX14_001445, partial [Amanita brunnescens Koide BX004]